MMVGFIELTKHWPIVNVLMFMKLVMELACWVNGEYDFKIVKNHVVLTVTCSVHVVVVPDTCWVGTLHIATWTGVNHPLVGEHCLL